MHEDVARRAHALLMKAVEIPAAERAAFVTAACAGDSHLQSRVTALLAALARAGNFLETPALDGFRQHAETPNFAGAPQKIGGYRVVRVIGVGGMATVYEAFQDQPRRRVALKLMRHGLAQTSAIRRFEYETEVLARLQHPGIAQIFEAGAWTDGHGVPTPFFAMEYIADARTITAYAHEYHLNLPDRLRMFATVCDAVQYGHQHGVIHRDLKPGNILVDPRGFPKVIDFGVARSSDPERARITQQTDGGQLIGTLNYISPEQCVGGADLDSRTDVYSLGVVLYELVCGRLPHDLSRASLPEALRVAREDAPAHPSSLDGRLRGDIDAIVLTAMDKDRERRYATAAALAADIRRYLRDEPIEARPPTLIRQCRLFVRRHRALVGALTAVLLVIVAGAVLSAGFAYQAARESRRRFDAETKALRERDAARWQAYIANIAGAFSALQANEFQQLRTRLALAAEEHRNWEWKFLAGQAERSQRTILAHEDMVFAFAASPDGRRLATGCRDGSWRVWDTASGARLAGIEGAPDTAIFSLAFSPDGKRIVSGAEDRTVRVWDTQTAKQVCLIGEHDSPVSSVSFGRNGLIASASDDGVARLWDGDSGELRRVLEDQPGGIHGVVFADDGPQLVTWSHDGSVWLRSADGSNVRHGWSFDGELECAAISTDGALVAAGGGRECVMVWDAVSGRLIHELSLPANSGTVRSLAFSRNGDRLAVGQIHRGILLWSLPDGGNLGQLRGHEEAVAGLWFAPDGNRLFSTSWDRTIRVWEVDATAGLMASRMGHDDDVIALSFSPDGAILASSGRDKVIRLWDPELGLPLGVLRGHRDAVYAVAFAPDGRLIASGSHDRSVRLWDAATGIPVATLEGHEGPVWSVAFRPDGRRLASAGDDAVLRIWDVDTRQLIHTLRGHARRIIHVAFSPDGRLLASASRDRSVRLWNANTGELLHTLTGHEADVFSVVFSHDGRRLYSGARDQTVRVWDTASGAPLRVLGGHGQFVTSLSLNPEGTRLAAGSWFGEIVLWDLATHEIVASFKGHELAIRAVVFAPNSRWLVSASYDRTIRFFDAAAPSERRAAHLQAQAQYDAAKETIARLSRDHPNAAQLAEAVEANAAFDSETRAWLRKLILMKSVGAAEQP